MKIRERVDLNAKGVGLGLTIADKLAKMLGPNGIQAGIKVRSKYGEGSRFSFIIVDKNKDSENSNTHPSDDLSNQKDDEES